VTDDIIDTAGEQGVPWLNGDQSAEPITQNKDWPDPQHTTGGEENDPILAKGVAVDGPELLSVGIGRKIAEQQPDERKGYEDPPIATILAHSCAQISVSEQRCTGENAQSDECERNSRRVGEESS
jgi:hypothetical protein